ncbi:SGNH/GDSL hydrolase family protein [Puniceibacterium sediminis]|uniref:GDSL-like Lipase/Acylhydrolase family protein n=1 Tax=Puniceibacterium sediminis TaxID=1608407 RepID=A0A238YMK4_9RHOB|nr:SGNH/GDSL hydrolase family protein [Puniceibacterium sediminis]SNR72018.1 hypothetical protein SAMN06265370_11825 [Puniceibacterium sediminis]
MIRLGTGLRFDTPGASAPQITPPPPVAAPAQLPVAATARWHPGFSDVTTAQGRIVSASDLAGLAGLTEGGAGIGPREMTDGLGRKFWRFTGAEFLNVAAGLVCDTRNMSAFMVGRVPRHPASWNRYFSIGNVAQGSAVNTLNAPLESRSVSQSAGHISTFGKNAYTAASGAEWMVPGAQMQVIGTATEASGSRLFLNERFVDVAAAYNATGVSGAEIGRYAWSPGASGKWGIFDLYELVVFSPGLDQSDALAVSQALMQAHGISPVEHQLVLEGDSIMQGTDAVTEALSAAAILTDPGASHVPGNWRVINKGISGNQVSDLVIKRDTSNSWTEQLLPGRNVMAFEIGRNDFVSGGQSAAQHYANVVAYLNSASTGILQRGWSVRAMANIAGSPSNMPEITAHRAALRAAQFLTDTASGPGQAFADQVSIVSTDLIEQGGQSVFLTSDDAADTTYYAGDSTHPGPLGARLRVTGGDTPQYGVAAGL